uniref:Glycosyltransferase n=1 Tax=Micromonospora echinospora TaxID=1877 RepID=A0A2C9DJT1_MICEC|nr:glycosyltransferase [Micromonospora echinospora]
MKFLFTVGGSQSTVFSIAPLATAARSAGHEILVTADEPLLETATAIGLPVVPSPHPGMPAARLQALLELTRQWPADVVVGGLSHVPGILATHLKALYVRHYWDIVPLRPEPGIEPDLERLGLTGPPEADLFIDVCPPCLRPSPTPGARPMRWIPRNRQGRLDPWMYTRPAGRPRVLVTAGTRNLMLHSHTGVMRQLVDQLTAAGAEVVIAAPDRAAEEFGAQFSDVRIGWVPLDVVAPTCDLAVHHGGAATAMTLMNAGVPQLITPDNDYSRTIAKALGDFGAALAVPPAPRQAGQEAYREAVDAVAAACRQILSDRRFAERARVLATEIGKLPTTAEMVGTIEQLAAAG